ncbi:DUF6191 domain-containing protein [Streptomyces sp. NPDC059092]|uniref:DUF6191 domain-containing protein n=1 Tax=Streptomyces sp. NPDC059092 TaxID=3346725 RepID=UPI0036B2D8F7
MIEEIFAPGRKHTHEEQKRLELSRVDVDDNDPGQGPIDLSSGKVTIRVPTDTAESADATGSTGSTDREEAAKPEDSGGSEDSGKPGE